MSQRKPTFSKLDEAIIKDGYVEFKEIIEAPFSSTVTKSAKDKVWQTITDRLNASSTVYRSPSEVHKKFKNLKSSMKQKIATEKRSERTTGGGSPVQEVSTTLYCLLHGYFQIII